MRKVACFLLHAKAVGNQIKRGGALRRNPMAAACGEVCVNHHAHDETGDDEDCVWCVDGRGIVVVASNVGSGSGSDSDDDESGDDDERTNDGGGGGDDGGVSNTRARSLVGVISALLRIVPDNADDAATCELRGKLTSLRLTTLYTPPEAHYDRWLALAALLDERVPPRAAYADELSEVVRGVRDYRMYI